MLNCSASSHNKGYYISESADNSGTALELITQCRWVKTSAVILSSFLNTTNQTYFNLFLIILDCQHQLLCDCHLPVRVRDGEQLRVETDWIIRFLSFVYLSMVSLARANFFSKVIFLDIYVTLVFEILNMYFAFWAFKGMLPFLSFQKKKPIWRLGHLAPQFRCPRKPLLWPGEIGSKVGWPPDEAEAWPGWRLQGEGALGEGSPLAAGHVPVKARPLSAPGPTQLFFLSQEGVLSSSVSGRASSLNPKAWYLPAHSSSLRLFPACHWQAGESNTVRLWPVLLLCFLFLSPQFPHHSSVGMVVPTQPAL